ncbi:MAG: hypothetical protein HEQ39_00640 [Rhizobacter sp.]
MGSAIGSTGTSLIAAVLLADLVSGVVHWAEDAYARVKPQRKIALINKIAEENDLHHERPRAFLAKGWWASSWDLFFVGSALLCLAWGLGWFNPAVLLFVVLSVNANQIHKWTHQNASEKPWWVLRLQRAYLLQTPRHHGRHHQGEKNSHYCVITNFLNPLLEEVGFWRRLESGVEKVTGRKPQHGNKPTSTPG